MATTTVSFSAPNVAIVVEKINSSVFVGLTAGQDYEFDNTVFVASNTYTTLTAAYNAAVAIDPNYPAENVLGQLQFTAVNVTTGEARVAVGDSISISSEYSVSAGTITYQWQKYLFDEALENGQGWVDIAEATTDTISSNVTSDMYGRYQCVVTATDSATGRTASTGNVVDVQPPLPLLDSSNAIGGSDPYGSINTGRGGGASTAGPNDLNLSYITLINTTYTQSELELYVPTTSTVISYDASLPAPYRFDSSGNCFNGTDFEMEIRVAATSLVLATVTVPETNFNETIRFYN